MYHLILPIIIVETHDVKKLPEKNNILEGEPGTSVLSTHMWLFLHVIFGNNFCQNVYRVCLF